MRPKRLDHIVFAVQDMQPAIDAWAETFGLKSEAPVRSEGAGLELAILPVGEAESADPFLELVAPAAEGSSVARHLAERGEGMLSISVEVEDLDEAVTELRAQDVPVAGPEGGVLPDSRIARIPAGAAHGVAIQLIERTRAG